MLKFYQRRPGRILRFDGAFSEKSAATNSCKIWKVVLAAPPSQADILDSIHALWVWVKKLKSILLLTTSHKILLLTTIAPAQYGGLNKNCKLVIDIAASRCSKKSNLQIGGSKWIAFEDRFV